MKLMLKATCACVLSLFVSATSVAAQAHKRFAVFGGYSSEADITFAPVSLLPVSLPSSVSLNGWNASFEAKLLPFLGIVADLSGHYGTYGINVGCEAIIVCLPVGVDVNSNLHTLMVGPQVSVSLWRFTPFAHVLLGAAHIDHTAAITTLGGVTNSDTSFADAIGGGLDFRIVSVVNWRFQADLIQTRFFAVSNPINFLTSGQSNFRGSTGVVVRF
jgi:hypothetical protein